ncbi:MAG: ankyrin repeat domain-containing protein [Candidatus Goldiibacteriota bacterium]|jgi:hypothetical protein
MKIYNFNFLEQELINALFRRGFGTASKIRKNAGVKFAGMDQEIFSKIALDFSFQGNYQGIYVLEWLGMDFSYTTRKYNTQIWLMYPANKGYYRYYRKLINNGVLEFYDYSAIFHDAAICGDRRLMELLIKKGMDIDSTIDGGLAGFTPLISAAKNNQISCVKVLLENGADIYIKDDAERKTVLEHNLSKEVRKMIEDHAEKRKK